MPLVREYTAEVTDNQLNVVFTADIDNASLCGIEVLQESVTEPDEPEILENSLSDMVCKSESGKINISGKLLVTKDNIGKDCVLIAASYTKEGVLDAVKTIDIKDIQSQSTEFNTELESDCRLISLFVWDTVSGMKNITEKYSEEI